MKPSPVVTRRATAWWTWATCGIAVACLPETLFPLVWIAAFVLPALFFYVLRWRFELSFSWSIALSGALHVITVLGAQSLSPDIEHVTALGCGLLPPMAFLAARRQGDDITWALFLALCVFLIAVIVAAPLSPPRFSPWGFIGAALIALQLETRTRAADRARVRFYTAAPRRRTFGSISSHLLASIAVATLVLQGLDEISRKRRPDPEFRSPEARDAPRPATVGLDDKFEFGPASQQLFDLDHNELVRVYGAAVDEELYLRTAHFELAGLDRWSKARAADQTGLLEEDVVHRGVPHPAVHVQRIHVEANENTDKFLFLPPGTLDVEGVGQVHGNVRLERFERVEPGEVSYSVAFQDRRAVALHVPFEESFSSNTQLPPQMEAHLQHFDRILDAADIGRTASPLETAFAITEVLRRECEYEMREPTGPYEHSILNFLSGEKRGFCMHFASALGICLQRLRIPARVAVGLYAGRDEAEDGVVRLGSQHAHAWVEVPLRGLGWVVVDPTPAALAGVGDSTRGDAETPTLAAVIDSARSWLSANLVWVAFGLLGLGFVSLFGRRRVTSDGDREIPKHVDRSAARRFRQLLIALHRVLPRTREQSLWGYANSLRAIDGVPIDDVERAFAAYEEVRFGRRAFDESRRESIDRALRAVKHGR